MNSYFDKLKFFNNAETPKYDKCDCNEKLNAYYNGEFSIVGKSFYVHKVSALGKSKTSHWQEILDAMQEMIKIGYVPMRFPIKLIKYGIFTNTLFIEVANPEFQPKNLKHRLKVFKDDFTFFLEQDMKVPEFEVRLLWFQQIMALPKETQLNVVKKFLTNNKYFLLMHCPLCEEKDSLISLIAL